MSSSCAKGQEQTVGVTLGRLEDGDKLITAGGDNGNKEPTVEPEKVKVLGMALTKLDKEARTTFEIKEEVQGVLIMEVEEGSAAFEKGIRPGDVITEIAQETVATPKEVSDRIDGLKKSGRKNALLMLASKTGELRFVTVRME